MFALIKSPEIYKRAEQSIINFLLNPFAVLEMWKGEKPTELEEVGEVILNQNNLDLVKLLPLNVVAAIKEPKREIIRKRIYGDEICVINTAVWSQNRIGECRIFHWGFRYITGTKFGFWQFEWNSSTVRFSGRRNSFFSGTNGLFFYQIGEFQILRLLTSEPDKPLIFQDTVIKPKEVVFATLKEEMWEFYLPLRKRERLIQVKVK